MPNLDRANEVLGMEINRDMPPAARGRIAKAKLQAQGLIPKLREVLYLDD